MKYSPKDLEFIGFCYADGSVSLVRYHKVYFAGHKTEYWLFRPQISICQRDDDLAVLQALKKEYGGSILKRSDVNYLGHLPNKYKIGNTKKGFVWTCTNIITCHRLCKLLLSAQFPYKKKKAVEIVYRFCDWKIKRGLAKKYTEKDRKMLENWWLECKRANSYQGGQVISA